jgi:hypothetical protein
MGKIKFEGNPPYALPIVQNVTARAEGAAVELTLDVIASGKEPSLVPIKVQMMVDFRPFFTGSIAACDNDGRGASEAVVTLPCISALHSARQRRDATLTDPLPTGHIRGHGCRNLLVYCGSGWCNHSTVMNADRLPDKRQWPHAD